MGHMHLRNSNVRRTCRRTVLSGPMFMVHYGPRLGRLHALHDHDVSVGRRVLLHDRIHIRLRGLLYLGLHSLLQQSCELIVRGRLPVNNDLAIVSAYPLATQLIMPEADMTR
jgi:hypothetical protein